MLSILGLSLFIFVVVGSLAILFYDLVREAMGQMSISRHCWEHKPAAVALIVTTAVCWAAAVMGLAIHLTTPVGQ